MGRYGKEKRKKENMRTEERMGNNEEYWDKDLESKEKGFTRIRKRKYTG